MHCTYHGGLGYVFGVSSLTEDTYIFPAVFMHVHAYVASVHTTQEEGICSFFLWLRLCLSYTGSHWLCLCVGFYAYISGLASHGESALPSIVKVI